MNNPRETFFLKTFSFFLRLPIGHFLGIGATFRVGSDMEIITAADRRLPNTDVVLALLKWIERFMMHRKPPRFSASMTMVVPINAAGPLVPSYATQPLEAQVEVGQ
jgi:hypothetical protein